MKKAASAGTPADRRDPRFANGPLAVVDVDTNGKVLAYCIGGLVLHVPAKSIPALVEWTLCEAKLGAPKLSGPGKDADPLLVLTATALERYGLPATLTDEERHAWRLPEGHKVIKQLVRAEWKLTKRGLGPWARIYRPATGSDPGPCPASRDCARSAACRRYNEDGIVELLYGLDSMGWTSAAPQWNIQQAGANWVHTALPGGGSLALLDLSTGCSLQLTSEFARVKVDCPLMPTPRPAPRARCPGKVLVINRGSSDLD